VVLSLSDTGKKHRSLFKAIFFHLELMSADEINVEIFLPSCRDRSTRDKTLPKTDRYQGFSSLKAA